MIEIETKIILVRSILAGGLKRKIMTVPIGTKQNGQLRIYRSEFNNKLPNWLNS